MRQFIIFVLLLSPLSLFAQQTACKEKIKPLSKQYDPGTLTKKVDSLIGFCETNHGAKKAISVAHAFAINRYYSRDYKTAIKYSLVELNYYNRLKLHTTKYNDVLYNIGRFNQLDGQFANSYKYYNRVVSLKIDSATTAKAYCQLGELKYDDSDPFSAVLYYKKGIAMYEQMGHRATLVRKLLDLAQIYEHINDPKSLKEKLSCLKKIDSLLPNTRVSTRNRMIHNNHYASYYNNTSTFDFAKSSYYYKKNVAKSQALNDTVFLSTTYANLANLYYKNTNDSAKYFIEQALSYHNTKVDRARILNIQTNYLIAKGKDTEALQAIHQSLLLSTGTQFTIDELPSFEELANAPDKKLVLWGLSKSSEIYINQYKKTKLKSLLSKALFNIQRADLLIDQMYLGAQQTASKLHWRKTASSIYGLGVFAANTLNFADDAFYYAEKKKAVQLTQEVVINFNKQLLPKQLIVEQNKLKRLRNNLEFKLDKTTGVNLKKILEDSIFSINKQSLGLQDSINTAFPEYARLINKTTIISLAQAQKNLDADTAVLHFIWDSKIAQVSQPGLMVITAAKTLYFELETPNAILANIKAFNKAVSKPFTTKISQEHFYTLSHELYNQLFMNSLVGQELTDKNLIIIPDGPIYNLAFEALITSPIKATYLIQKHQVSYVQSLSFKQFNAQIDRSANTDYVGFAPITYSQMDLADLPYAESEVDQALNIFKGVVFKQSNANRVQFFDKVPNANVVHLATHAQSKGYSWIALNDSLVSLHELYAQYIPAHLVVLSGCSTNLGKSLEGEGVASLARGFFYAGANSVVSTLWNTNDKTTANITTTFYKELKKGQSKAAALQFAKVNYLSSASLSDASPYYWASMILMGDEHSLPLVRANTTLITTFLTLLLFISLILFKKKYKPRVTNTNQVEQ